MSVTGMAATVWLQADVVTTIVQQRLDCDVALLDKLLLIAHMCAQAHHQEQPHAWFAEPSVAEAIHGIVRAFRRPFLDPRGQVWTLILERQEYGKYEVRWLMPAATTLP